MDTKSIKTMFARTMYIMVILAVALSVTSVAHAAPKSPFIGQWEATDVDGSDMTLSIAGRRSGPFQITWADDYISLCAGEAGLVRGTGWLNEGNSNLLEADVRLECFTTGATLDFHVTFRYHPGTNTLSILWSFEQGQVTIWYRPGKPQVAPPTLNLRVNYGHDWVESFYEGGHMSSIMVTDSEGNVKATAELVTEPKDYWGGETGFQSLDSVWFDGDGNQMDYPPDIQPNDWVYGWVDNGASAQAQIGEISGMIDLANDSIEGTIYAPWFSDPVPVECLDWGSGQEPPFNNADGGYILTDGSQSYSCSWDVWDIQPGQTIGVGYFGPDGHWVANAFYVRPLVLYIHYEYPDVVEGDYELGHTVQVTVFDSEWNTKATATVETMEMPHWGGAPGFRVEQWDGFEGPPDIQPGDVVRAVVDDGLLTAETRIGEIAATIDLHSNSITGTIDAPWAGDPVDVLCMPWGGAPEGASEKETTVTPDGSSEFTCIWDSTEWDIQPDQHVGVAYTGSDGHWVANGFFAPNPRIVASEAGNWFWTTGFYPGTLDLFIYESADEGAALLWQGQSEADQWGFTIVGYDVHGQDLVPGNYLVVSDGVNQKGLVLQPISVTFFDTKYDFMAGIAPLGSEVWAAAGPQEWQQRIFVEADPLTGEWLADFAAIGFDITEEMQPWSYAHIYDGDGDANEGGVPPLELWAAVFTYDPPDWTTGEHSYYFDNTYTFPISGGETTPPIAFTVSNDALQYEGYVLLRPFAVRARVDGECPAIDPMLHPDQMTRFVYGWVTDYPMTYNEALAHFDSMTINAYWDDGQSAELVRHEIIPFASVDWAQYVCTFTE